MGYVLIQLIPLIIGSMMTPTWVLLVLLLLSSGKGRFAAIAFVGGVTAVKLIQGVIFGIFVNLSHIDEQARKSSIVISTLLVIVGILMWVTALTLLFRREDPEGSVPWWTRMVNAITPLKSFGVGAVLVVTSSRSWIFTLTALAVIGRARLNGGENVVAFLFFVVGSILLLVTPIFLSIGSSATFNALARWLEKYEHPIMIVISFLVGAFFLWLGVSGLM